MPDERGNENQDAAAPVRARGFVVGFLLIAPVVYAVTNAVMSAIFSLMVAPVSALLIVLLLNAPLRKWLPKLSLNRVDLIIVYAITSVAAAAGGEMAWLGHTGIDIFAREADTNPAYRDFFLKYLPDWLIVRNPKSIQDLSAGGHDWLYVFHKLPLYLPKYVAWGGLFCSLMLAMLCLNSLMRGAWLEREKLAFPIIQLPVAMTESGKGSMWRSRYMWIAFGLMFAIDMLNGLNYLYPNLPSVPVKQFFDLQTLFKEPPWSNIGQFTVGLYPFMAALGLFMPSDLLLSFIVFFLLRKATHVALASYGIPQDTFSGTAISPGPPYFDEQTWGGVLALFAGTMWYSRSYLREVLSAVRTGSRSGDGGVKHRWAFVGLIVSFAVVVGYGLAGGLPAVYVVPYVLLFLIFSFVLTRLRAQLGPPTHEFAFFGPTSFMSRFTGTGWLSDGQATWISQVFLFMNRTARNHPMPYQLEAMKMGGIARVSQKRMFQAIAVAMVLGFFLAYFFLHVFNYRTGESQPTYVNQYLQTLREPKHGPDSTGILMTVFGFLVVMLLDALRIRFPGFALHPAGYVLSMNFGVDYYWFGLLIALIVKNFVQRYYGLRGYDKLRSVALGILLAEYAAETIWMGMALITKHSTYTISFNDRSLGGQ